MLTLLLFVNRRSEVDCTDHQITPEEELVFGVHEVTTHDANRGLSYVAPDDGSPSLAGFANVTSLSRPGTSAHERRNSCRNSRHRGQDGKPGCPLAGGSRFAEPTG